MKVSQKFLLVALLATQNSVLFSTLVTNASTSAGTVQFARGEFLSASQFFLASKLATAQNFTIASASLQTALDSALSVTILPFTSSRVLINYVVPEKTTPTAQDIENAKQANPLYNTIPAVMSSFNGVPVVTVPYVFPLGYNQQIALVQSVDSLATTTVALNDGSGGTASAVVGLKSSSQVIFAAVAPQSGAFGGVGSGLSMVKTVSGQLVTMDATTGTLGGNKAVLIDTTAGILTAITAASALGSIIDMYWDSTLSRLFVALSVHRSSAAVPGGCVALLVGRVDGATNKLILEPAVPLDSTLFTSASTHFILGFNSPGDGIDIFSSLYKVRTMNTSTGRSYVILNGGVTLTNAKNKIYALPVVPPLFDSSGAISNSATSIGKVAKKTTPFGAATIVSDMLLDTDAAAMVGAGDVSTDSSQAINVLTAVGDTVFAGLSGSTAATSGFFSSTALFDANGNVTRWTPWQRVMGSVDPILAGGFDIQLGGFIYLTNDTSANPTQIKATQWGQGFNDGLLGGVSGQSDQGLVALLENEFSTSQGGIFSLIDCDNATPSFKSLGTTDNISLLIATGYQKIALIQTGTQPAAGVFTPTSGSVKALTLHSTTGSAVAGSAGTLGLVVSGGALNTLGPISTADVSRVDALGGAGKTGYLLVGGVNGVAVLSEVNGDGWDTTAGVGLKNGLVGITSTMSFKVVGAFSNVKKIVCDNAFAYILTNQSLYRMALTATNFSSTGALNPTFVEIANAASIISSTNASFYDVLISSQIGLVGTNKGLFKSGNLKNITTVLSSADAQWKEILLPVSTTNVDFPAVLRFVVASVTKGGFTKGGTVYAVCAYPGLRLGFVIRMTLLDTSTGVVQDNSCVPITEPNGVPYYLALGNQYPFFTTDGAVSFYDSSQQFTMNSTLNILRVMQNSSLNATRGKTVDIDTSSQNVNLIGAMVRNSGSGAWMVPGDFGVRVHE